MKKTALILGGFGGVGYACATILAKNGYDIFIVNRGRRAKTEENKRKVLALEAYGVKVADIKANAANKDDIVKVCDQLKDVRINCLVHAIADGNVGNIFSGDRILKEDSFMHTFNSMCVSFVTWTQELLANGILEQESYIFGFTSEGTSKNFPNYAANGVAKAGLETLCKYMADELEERKISVNILRSGIMDTNAVRALGDYGDILKFAERNACRFDTPENVAKKMMDIMQDEEFISGQVVDVWE